MTGFKDCKTRKMGQREILNAGSKPSKALKTCTLTHLKRGSPQSGSKRRFSARTELNCSGGKTASSSPEIRQTCSIRLLPGAWSSRLGISQGLNRFMVWECTVGRSMLAFFRGRRARASGQQASARCFEGLRLRMQWVREFPGSQTPAPGVVFHDVLKAAQCRHT